METSTKSLWQIRNWRTFWAATSVSTIGDIIFDITALLWVSTVLTAGTQWGPMAVSGLVMCGILPVLLFGTLAGTLADRFPTRPTMVVCNIIQGTLIASILPLVFVYESLPLQLSLAWIYTAVGLSNMAGVVFGAGRMKLISTAIPKEHWPQASSLLQGTGGAIAVVGPPLAAPLLFSVGPWVAYAANSLSFFVSTILLCQVALTPATKTKAADAKASLWAEMSEGFKFVFGHRILSCLIISIFFVTLGTAPINSLQVFFVPENLGVAAQYIGFLSGSVGVGAMIGAFGSAAVAKRLGMGRMYVATVFLVGITLITYARTTNLIVGCMVLVLAGVLVGSVNAALSPLIMTHAPEKMLGRVSGVMGPLQQGASLISISVAGFAASALTTGFALDYGPLTVKRTDLIFTICGCIILLAAAFTCRPILQALDTTRQDDEQSEQEPQDASTV